MALVENWMPPSHENWELITYAFQFFPLVTIFQWINDFYPQGKSSIDSKLNVPGKIGWATMEAPGFITMLYIMYTVPQQHGLTWQDLPTVNKVMAALFTIHYLYRAILAPLFLNPSMSPIHLSVWLSAFSFQVINGTCIGGWVAGYGTPSSGWFGFAPRFTLELGMMIWFFGFIGNIYHDDELREIRRAAARNQKRRQAAEDSKDGKSKTVDKVYMVPQNGLFRAILYPHYLCEWVEWLGFWIIGGQHCIPAKNFVLAEVSTMTPRALSGKRWYITRFGKDKIGNRKAVIPGIL